MQLISMATLAGTAAFACMSCSPPKKLPLKIAPPPTPTVTTDDSPTSGTLSNRDVGAPGYGDASFGNNPIAKRILDAHNAVRTQVTPKASPPLVPLVWSDELARQAQRWADRCAFDHSRGQGYGENIYARGKHDSTPERAIQSFADEAEFYDYARNACMPGKECGHYTQVVWAASTSVGCAVSHCETNSPFPGFSSWDFWVCQYLPAGNVVGQKPY